MSAINMITPVTLETVKEYAVNDGMMCILDEEDVTSLKACENAEEVIALVNSITGKWLGATSGVTDISEGRENWSPDHNGLRIPHKGSQWLNTAKPGIKAKLVQMRPSNIAIASGGADITGENTNAIWIKPRTTYKDEDYHAVMWFTNYGPDGIIGTIMYNALCITGLKWQMNDKKVGTCDVEFRGHADNVVANDYLPMEHFIFKSGNTANTASQEG